MSIMKPTLFALTALGAIAATTPALAQSYNGYGSYNNGSQYQSGYYNQGYDNRYANNYQNDWETQLNSSSAIDTRIGRLDARLQAGLRDGTIDRYEADRLRAELRDLRAMNRRYSYNGITAAERADLAARLRSVREDIRTADNGSWDRYDNGYWSGGSTGYGYNNGGTYNNGSAYGSTYNNGSGYGSTYDNRSGYGSTYGNGYGSTYNNGYGSGASSNNGYYGQGGPYEEVETCDSRQGVIGGLIDSVVGRNCTTTLRVGQRVSGGLYGVPYELRNQYRDGYGYYYRSDGNAIYQIDTRTNTVLRIYPMNR